MSETFEPKKHLIQLKGKDYLEVKWRLVWFRGENPGGKIETELIDRATGAAMFKATITKEDGGVATGHGSETQSDFGDYLEKAETKAIGRALGALGYGTQFSDDFDFGAESQGKVVDAPVERRSSAAKSAPATQATPSPAGDPSKFADDEVVDCDYPGCANTQTGKFANICYSKFHRILCGQHWAMAKKGELDEVPEPQKPTDAFKGDGEPSLYDMAQDIFADDPGPQEP